MRYISALLLCAFSLSAQTAVFPSAVASDANLKVAVNRLSTNLTSTTLVGDTVLIVASTTGFVANSLVSLDNEIISICGIAGANVLNVGHTGACPNINGRGFDGTTAAIHLATGAICTGTAPHGCVAGLMTAWHRNSDRVEIEATQTALGANLSNIPGTPSGAAVPISKGGTGATTQPGAFAAIVGAATLPVANGGTAVTAAQGAGTGTKVQLAVGAAVTGNVPMYDSSGALVDSGLVPVSSTPAYLNSLNYVFAAQTCAVTGICIAGGANGATLAIGNTTVTMTPVPLGVAGTHTVAGNLPHRLYVSGGTGAAEGCLIAGGAGTSGAASGTIILNCANTHTGAFTIQSNTTGVQEAIYAAGNSGAVRMPPGPIQLWSSAPGPQGALTIPDGYATSLRGSGIGATIVRTHGTTGNWIVFDYASLGAFIDTGDYSLLDDTGTLHTAGIMLWTRWRTDGNVGPLYIDKGYDDIWVEANVRAVYHDMTLGGARRLLYITCNGAHQPACQSGGSYHDILMSSVLGGGDTVRLEAPIASMVLTNVSMGSVSNTGNSAVRIISTSTLDTLNEIMFVNCIIDGHAWGIRVTGNGSTYNSNSIQVVGGRINSATLGVLLEAFVDNFSTNGTIIVSAGGGGVGFDRAIALLGDVRNASFMNSPKIGTDGDACLIETGNASNIVFSNNVCGDIVGGIRPLYAFYVLGTITGLEARGNNLTNVLTGILNNAGALAAPVVWSSNTGIDNVIPAVTAAATTALPLNPTFTLTGATAVGAVTYPLGVGAVGQKFTFIATNVAPGAWTAGATIGNTFTPTQNVPVNCYWSGTQVFCKP